MYLFSVYGGAFMLSKKIAVLLVLTWSYGIMNAAAVPMAAEPQVKVIIQNLTFGPVVFAVSPLFPDAIRLEPLKRIEFKKIRLKG